MRRPRRAPDRLDVGLVIVARQVERTSGAEGYRSERRGGEGALTGAGILRNMRVSANCAPG
jgi:hypothetical protein